MASRELPPSNPISEIPDLEVGLTSKRHASTSPRTEADVRPIAAQPPSYGLEGILDDDLFSSDIDAASLDIDVSDSTHHTGINSPAPSMRAWPDGKTPEPGSVEIAPSQIEQLCSWGESPAHWWQAIIYAFLVYQGQRQLRDQARPVGRELNQAETRRDECLAHLAMTLRDSVEREDSLNSAREAVNAALAEQQQLAEQQRSAEASLSSETLALNEAMAKSEADLDELNKQVTHFRVQSDEAEIALKREQARLQRLGIEQRNLEQPGPQGTPARARLEELAEQAEAMLPRIDLAQTSANSARAALDATASAIKEKSSHVRELQRRKELVVRALSSQSRRVVQVTDGANERQRKALADLGRAILAARGRIAVDDTALVEIARHDEAVATIWRRQQVYSLALASFDQAAVRRGTRLAIGLLALVLVLFVWRLAR
jgi:hypothetical protein